MVLKFGRHLATPEIFPITSTHEYHNVLMKFVLTSFPNIGLPVHKESSAFTKWHGSWTRTNKILLSIPGKSEEERYKSHLTPRKLAARWSDIFEIRTAETSVLHGLLSTELDADVRAALPPVDQASNKAAVVFLGKSPGDAPKASAVFDWPIGEEDLVMQILELAMLAAPALSPHSAELLCRSLAIKRVYCLVMIDPSDSAMPEAVQQLKDSRTQYLKEVSEIRESGGDVGEEEDNFMVFPVRLFTQRKGLQPSIATCHAPAWGQVEKNINGATAWLLDLDMTRLAPLPGLTSFRSIYPTIAYEESLGWVDEGLHPFLSLPDCNEGVLQHMLRKLRTAPFWEVILQMLLMLFLFEAAAKATLECSLKWAGGAFALLLLTLLRLAPFLRLAARYVPASIISRTEL
jgi:hypothetical protein